MIGLLRGPLWPSRAAAFLTTFDRFTIAPMLVTIAAALGVSLEEVAVAASVYYLLYGLMQPVWGMLSDRLGRVRVMRLALLAVLLPGLISAVAPSLAVLVAGGFAFMATFRHCGPDRGSPWAGGQCCSPELRSQ